MGELAATGATAAAGLALANDAERQMHTLCMAKPPCDVTQVPTMPMDGIDGVDAAGNATITCSAP